MANGQLDPRSLAQIEGEPGDLLRADACGYWNALQRAFRAAMGYGLGVREAYRPLGTQIGYFVTRYTKTSRNTGIFYDGTYWAKKPGVPAAARPGTSKHGEGLAVDATIDSFTSPAYRWMAANAGRYGFGNNQGRNDGEPWHWVFGETRPTVSVAPAAIGSTPIDNQEDDLQADERAALMEIRDNMPGRVNVHEDGDLWKKILRLEALIVAADANVRGDVAHAVNGALMPRLAQIVEWLNGRIDVANHDRSAEADELLAALRAVAPGDTTVLADLTPVLAAVESLKASLPEATRKALAAALAS
jgi:hypothetical protein